MKITALLTGLLLWWNHTKAQFYDRQWAVGARAAIVTFETDTILIDSLISPFPAYDSWASICNPQGELQFFSNGRLAFLPSGDTVEQSELLNWDSDWVTNHVDGIPGAQNMIALHYPNHTDEYFIVYNTLSNVGLDTFGGWLHPDLCFAAHIHMNFNGTGQARMLSRQLLYSGNIGDNRMTACQHGNGRDWWIVIHGYNNNEYIKFLLSPNGFSVPDFQFIGCSFQESDAVGMARFSPDGSHYVSATGNSKLSLLDFDRCTGVFSNPDSLFIAYDTLTYNSQTAITGGGAWGLEYSPSGRFLYLNDYYRVVQYDFDAPDFAASRQLVKWWNPSYNCQPFDYGQLAPNGKIYIGAWGSGPDFLHVINEPDSLGIACGVEFCSLYVPGTNNTDILPNLPRFRLGAIAPCDTIINGIENIIATEGLKISPNPATTQVQIDTRLYLKDATLTITDETGRTIFQSKDFYLSQTVDVSKWASGVYFVKLSNADRKFTSKLVKQ